MGYTLHLTEQENIVLSHATARRLLQSRDGNAALLYLFLLQEGSSADPQRICRELQWDAGTLARAEDALRRMGLVSGGSEAPPAPEPAEETPEYSSEDVSQTLENDTGFALLAGEVEKKLGKKLTRRDLQILLGMYDELGLPGEVIFQLLCHCVERTERCYGAGRRPTMRQVEKEAYGWARRGIFTLKAAEEYLRHYAATQGKLPELMAALRLGGRNPVPSEEKYLLDWLNWGFPPETVSLAYDKTVLKCGELKWPYLNGILRRWHEQGLHTPEQIQQEHKPQGQKPTVTAEENQMRHYVESLHRK